MFRFQRQDLIAHRQTPSWYQLNMLEFKFQPQQVASLVFSLAHKFATDIFATNTQIVNKV